MAELSIKDEFADMLGYFGEPDKLANFAVKDFLVRSCQEKLSTVKRKVKSYEQKYAMDFEEFKNRVQSDENYVNKIEEKEVWRNL